MNKIANIIVAVKYLKKVEKIFCRLSAQKGGGGGGYLKDCGIYDRAERHDLISRFWLSFSPFLFPPKKRGKKKRRINGKNRDLSHVFLHDRYLQPPQYEREKY